MSDAQAVRESDVNQLVADNVRAELSRQRWSGRQAAVALGVTNTYISRRTSGTTPMDPSDLDMFARFLRVPVSHFFLETAKAPGFSANGESRGLLLPELDSNQQPAGSESAAERLVNEHGVPVIPWTGASDVEDDGAAIAILRFDRVVNS